MICKKCGIEKQRLVAPTTRKDGRTQFVDENGAWWDGRLCPQCKRDHVNAYHRTTYKSVRKAKKTTRLCRKCQKPLPKTHYFHHERCAPGYALTEGGGQYTADDWGYGSSLTHNETVTVSQWSLLA